MYRFAKAIDAKSRDPRIPLLLSAQLVRDDKQRDREDQPVEEAALSIVPNCRKSVDKLPPGRYILYYMETFTVTVTETNGTDSKPVSKPTPNRRWRRREGRSIPCRGSLTANIVKAAL